MDNKKEYVYRDSSQVEHSIEISSNDFNLAQKSEGIHDQKFKTKPTTFLKDAFRRFRKNKSSVAGAIILGSLLLLSIVLPLAIPYNIDASNPHPEETLLAPKLFNTGTGFWDGTEKKTNIPVDPSRKVTFEGVDYYYPFESSYPSRAVSNLTPARGGYVNIYTQSATGGFLSLVNDKIVESNETEKLEENAAIFGSPSFNYALRLNTYDLSFAVANDDFSNELQQGSSNADGKGYSKAKFKVYFTYSVPSVSKTETFEYVLKDYEDENLTNATTAEVEDKYGEQVLSKNNITTYNFENVFEGLKTQEITYKHEVEGTLKEETFKPFEKGISNPNLKVSVLPNSNNYTYLMLKNVTLTSSDKTENNKLAKISFADGVSDLKKDSSQKDYYWTFTGRRELFHGIGLVADFTFDTYAVPYGIQIKNVGSTLIETYIKNGWLSLTNNPEIASASTDEDIKNAVAKTLDKGYKLTKQKEINALFKVEEKCPIYPYVEGNEQSGITKISRSSHDDITVYNLSCYVYGYKFLGYDSMPSYFVGTDAQGFDLLKSTFVGLRNSLMLGLLTFAICFSFGLVWGALSGYFGGATDIIMQRFTDILSGVPWIVIMTLCILNMGSGFGTFILAMCLTGWIGTASLTRTQFYRFRDREYTLASRTLGANDFRLIFKHILPNAMGTIITSSVLMIPSVIFSEATISYLGLGFQSMKSLGVILSKNQGFLSTYPYLILFPSIIMALIMISFNLFGNGLRDAFNPSLKGSE